MLQLSPHSVGSVLVLYLDFLRQPPNIQRYLIDMSTVLRIHLILMRIRILDPHWKKSQIFCFIFFCLKLDEPFKNEEIFIISFFQKFRIRVLGVKKYFFCSSWLIFYPLDPDPWIRIYCLYIYTLSVCLYPINVRTAEQIGSKLCVEPHMTPWKIYGCLEVQKVVSKIFDFVKFCKSAKKLFLFYGR